MNPHRMARRTFLGATLATAAAPAILHARKASDKLNIAVIGTGGRGAANLAAVASENIVALCDVDARLLAAAGAQYPHAWKFTDFRKLFDHARLFDAVVVSTCEHTHALATLRALQHDKHVYCEKPLTHNVAEARRVRQEAARRKVATQMGIQIHATENYHRVVELVRAGILGPVREVHVWVARAWGWQTPEQAARNHDIVSVRARPKAAQPIPASLAWDLWLGPAPARPFHSVYVPGPKWYRWWAFGNGTMSDLGSHWNDLPFWALQLKAPLTIEASGPAPHPEIAPASLSVVYEYGARGEFPPVKLAWYQGEHKPAIWKEGGIPQWPNGCLFLGDRGMLLADYGKHLLLPERDFAGFKPPAPTLPRSRGHHAEWIEACKSGKPTAADFQYAGWLTEANHLGNVAYRVGKKLEWDAEAMRAPNAPEADVFLHRTYRKGWEL